MHNNLRITRILKSLGELGFEHYQAPLVRFFLEETLVKKNLSSVKRSVLDYFVFAVRDKRERRKLIRYAYQHYEPKDKFVWCPRRIQKRFKKKSEKRQESAAGNGDNTGTDEGRSRGKAKDTESGSGQRETKPMEDVSESQSLMEEDNAMSVDSEKPSPGESVPDESLSGNPLPNGTKNNNENGEMEQSSSSDASPAKEQESKDDDSDSGQQKEVTKEPGKSKLDSQEMASPEPEVEKPLKKKREGDTALSGNGLTSEPPSSPPQSKGPSEPTDSQANLGSQGVGEVSPVKRLGKTVDERAEKQPRTDFSGTPDATDNGETTSKTSTALAVRTANKVPQANHQTNGTDVRNSEEPMDVEESNTADLQGS